MRQLALLDDYHDVARTLVDWDSLPDTRIVGFRDHLTDREELVARLLPFEVVVVARERTPVPKSLIDRLPNLRLLVTTGPRNASIDVAAANAAGVTVCGTRAAGGWPTAELAWGLVLAVARSIPAEDAGIRAGGWLHTIGLDLRGRTLGLLGLGELGSKVAEYGIAFGMDVIAWSPNLTVAQATRRGVRAVTKDQLFADSDVISVHVRLGPRSMGVIAEAELRQMRPTAILVNTSRGPIIDEQALLRALEEGWIGGAGLDVFDSEPLPVDHPLRRAPRTVLTPHVGHVTVDNYAAYYGDALEDVRAFIAGSPVRLIAPPPPGDDRLS